MIPILPYDDLNELEKLGNRHISTSTTNELLEMKEKLEAKDAQINRLQKENEEIKRFFENRLSQIKSQLSTNDLLSRIKMGETAKLEFKSTLRWNIKKKSNDKDIENVALKTIVAFCNTDGGELLIGVSDEGEVLGIEKDGFPNTDKLLVHLGNLITQRIIPQVVQFVDYEIVGIGDKILCRVMCKKSATGIWLKPDNKTDEQFFVRTGPASKPLSPRDAVEYIRQNFD